MVAFMRHLRSKRAAAHHLFDVGQACHDDHWPFLLSLSIDSSSYNSSMGKTALIGLFMSYGLASFGV